MFPFVVFSTHTLVKKEEEEEENEDKMKEEKKEFKYLLISFSMLLYLQPTFFPSFFSSHNLLLLPALFLVYANIAKRID